MTVVRKEPRPVVSIYDLARKARQDMKAELAFFDRAGFGGHSLLWCAMSARRKYLLK